jgi:hypothetical protein
MIEGQRGVFEVDPHPVEPGEGEQFSHLRAAECDERADESVPPPDAGSEVIHRIGPG